MDKKKKEPHLCCLQETCFKYKNTYRLKVKGCKTIYHANNNQRKAGVDALILDRTNINARKVIRDKEGHHTIIKESVLQKT